jgi:hypothetical protein
MCTFGHPLPAVFRAERQDLVNGEVVTDTHAVCIVCIVEAVQDYVKRRDAPPAAPAPPAGLTNLDRQKLKDLSDLVEQLQGEVRDVVARSFPTPPAP